MVKSIRSMPDELISTREAGKKGGLVTRERYGRQYYVRAGRRGAIATINRHRDKLASWGRLGGRPRKPMIAEEDGAKDIKRR